MRGEGLLLLAYGSPRSSSEEDVCEFLAHVLGYYRGAVPHPRQIKSLQKRYQCIGGPNLHAMLEHLCAAVSAALDEEIPGRFRVAYAMRHSEPWIGDVLARLARENIRRIRAVPLAPFRSSFSTGGYIREVEKSLQAFQNGENVRIEWAEPWADCPEFHRMWVRILRRYFEDHPVLSGSGVHVVFVNHSLPEVVRQRNEPYEAEFFRMAGAIAAALGMRNYSTAYTSAGGGRGPWLGPSLEERLERLADEGTRTSVMVAPIGFLSAHLEVLYDIDISARNRARDLGLRLYRPPMPADTPFLVPFLVHLARGCEQSREAE